MCHFFYNLTNQLEIVRVLLHCFVFDKVVLTLYKSAVFGHVKVLDLHLHGNTL